MHTYLPKNYNSPKHGRISADNVDKKLFKNWVPFTNSISKINNTEIDNSKRIDAVMPMKLTEYSEMYSKTYRSLWKYYRDEPVLNK